MNDLISTTSGISGQIKLTSLDIAEMTGKLHKNVMRDIKHEIDAMGKVDALIFEPVNYTDNKGELRPCYEFGKAGAMSDAG